MYLAWYISSHGFGHMTRCLAIIEKILTNTDYKLYIVCNKNQNDFAKIYLSEYKSRIIYKELVTDIGLVNKENSLEVDKFLLQQQLLEFISSWEYLVNDEYEFLKNLNLKCIISDISPIGNLVGKKLQLPVLFISNFTWVEQYEYIEVDKYIIDKYRQAYSYVTKFLKYDLCLPIDSINSNAVYNTGLISRKIDNDRVKNIKLKYGNSIMITCGKSANLKTIKIKNFNGTIFTTSGINIICEQPCNIVNLSINIKDTQNYIAASSLVITKAGWGTIAESILGRTPIVLIERPSAIEDSFNIEQVKKNKLGISIREKDLETIDIEQINKELKENIDYRKLNTYKSNVDNIVKLITD